MSSSAMLPRNNRQLVFTSSQAARYLGVSLATVRRWTDAGYISCYRTPGGQRRFAAEQLDVFISSMHREGPNERPPTRGLRAVDSPPEQPTHGGARVA
jgi:excisionase family DNA binding protein